MYTSAADLVEAPAEVATVTSTLPAAWAGALTVRSDALRKVTVPDGKVVEPNLTVAPLTKFVPATVTVVPPAVEPEDGESPVTVGLGSV